MDRRSFAATVAAAAIGQLLEKPRRLRVGLTCSPFYPNGVQRCEAGIDSTVLDVTASDTQHASEWCWAACIEGVLSYYGHAVPQERIVAEAYGAIENLPGSPSAILRSLNRKWIDEDGDEFRVSGLDRGTNAITSAQDLANDHPLIIGTLGHAMILTALTYDRDTYGRGQVILAEVRDPWPFNPRHRVLSAQEWYNIQFAVRIRV